MEMIAVFDGEMRCSLFNTVSDTLEFLGRVTMLFICFDGMPHDDYVTML